MQAACAKVLQRGGQSTSQRGESGGERGMAGDEAGKVCSVADAGLEGSEGLQSRARTGSGVN